jgi:RimJ/RimL family protein N-acetyltransferase
VSGGVSLRPFRAEDFDAMWAARGEGSVPVRSRDEEAAKRRMRARIERSGRFVEGRIDFAIELDGRLVGGIEARQPREGLPRGAYELGISVFAEADRGRGVGTRAVELMTDRLFEDPETARVQASTWVENQAMRRALEQLGFALEGVLRSFMPRRDGGRDDYALYAVTRGDWEARR